jgi:hypothetical protein
MDFEVDDLEKVSEEEEEVSSKFKIGHLEYV